MSNFKKGEVVEIINTGSSLARDGSITQKLTKRNNISDSFVSNWGNDIGEEVKKAIVIDFLFYENSEKCYYLLKILNSKWYIVLAEVSDFNTLCIKKEINTNQVKNIKHIINGTTTIVILPNGNKGIAKLHPDYNDEFDEYEGFRIAYARANGINPFPEEEVKLETTNTYKIGETISRKEAINIIKNGGKIKNDDLIYYLNEKGDLVYCNNSYGTVYISSGYKENFFEDDNYIIYELPTKNNNKPFYTDEELLEELKNRLNNNKE